MLKQVYQDAKRIVSKKMYYALRPRFIGRLFPFKNPPILLLSYPRSGSSWVGKILSTSFSTAYLREPITQPYLRNYGRKYTLVDINEDKLAFSIYKKLGDKVFQGIPSMHPGVVNNPRDFFYIFRRNKKHLLIKEVNPRATNFFYKRYGSKIILLLRHPAALALSFYQRGWLNSPDALLDTNNPEGNAWEKFGYAYGTIMKHAFEIIKKDTNKIIIYENLATDPMNQFERLFRLLELELPIDYEEIIQRYCYSAKLVKNPNELERSSKDMIHKWRKELSAKDIFSLKKGFFLSGLEFYTDPVEWSRD